MLGEGDEMNEFGQEPRLGAFPIHRDSRGSLGVVEFTPLPFSPRRLFWIHEVAKGETRANHGHRVCEQLVFVQQGSVKGYTIDADGDRFDFELLLGDWVYVPVRHWLQINSFDDGTVVGVLASHPFDAEEYIDDPNDLRS